MIVQQTVALSPILSIEKTQQASLSKDELLSPHDRVCLAAIGVPSGGAAQEPQGPMECSVIRSQRHLDLSGHPVPASTKQYRRH